MAEEMKDQKETQAAEAVAIEPSEFESLLKKEFKPKSDHAREAISSAVRTLAEQALSETALISDEDNRVHYSGDRPEAVRADQSDYAPRGLSED
jgi:predicted component of type VI protein secretion system